MRVSPEDGYALWAHHYDTDPNPLLALEERTLFPLLEPIPRRLFIDVACGTGRWMSNLLARGGDVLGCDACESMLKRAAVKQGLQGKCVLANGTLLPFAANAADVTLCSFAAGYFPDVFQLVDELARVTRHGGRVLLTDLHPRAVAAGWTRSFRAGASVYEIEHYAHSEEYLCAAGECAGLTLEARLQFSLDEPERALFERAGKSNMFHKASLIPAIWIGVWRTP